MNDETNSTQMQSGKTRSRGLTPGMVVGVLVVIGLVCGAIAWLPLGHATDIDRTADQHASGSGLGALQANYQGVTPDGGEPPPMPSPRAGEQLITWPGFQVSADGRTRIFMQLTGLPAYRKIDSLRGVDIVFEATNVTLKNNLRHLDTRYFDSPVRGFRLSRSRRYGAPQIKLHVDLRRPNTPSELRIEHRGNHVFMILEF